MTFLKSVIDFIYSEEGKKKQSPEDSREHMLALCREQEARQIAQVLIFNPTLEDINQMRSRFDQLISDPSYCGNNQFVLDRFDEKNT